MNKLILMLSLLIMAPCFADNIQYGYNAVGEYVPTSVGNTQINYGYNAQGNYVPVSTTPAYSTSNMYAPSYNPNRINNW